MEFIKAILELLEGLTADNKKSHAAKKVGGAMAKKSFKKLRRVGL